MKLMPVLNMSLTFKLLAAIALATQISACVPVVVGGAAAGGAMAADRRTTAFTLKIKTLNSRPHKKFQPTCQIAHTLMLLATRAMYY